MKSGRASGEDLSLGRHTAAAAGPGIVQPSAIDCMSRHCADIAKILALGEQEIQRKTQLGTVIPNAYLGHIEVLE